MALYTVQTTYPPAAQDLNQAITLLSGATGPMQGGITIANRIRAQITGATAASGLVGMTAAIGSTTGGPPTSGTWATGDLMTDPVMVCIWICVSGGTPGTWYRIGGGNTAGGLRVLNVGQIFTTRTGRTGFDIVGFDEVVGQKTHNFPGSSSTLSAITIQNAGTYFFFGSASIGGGTVGQDIGIMLLKNGQPYQFGSQFLGYGAPSLQVSAIVTTAVNDVIQLGVYSEGTYSITTGYTDNVLYGTFLSN
jgi:hypothetical protein